MAAAPAAAAYLLDADQMKMLRELSDRLHAGTDRERNAGHRLWLVLSDALPLDADAVARLGVTP